jgi:hypothetical protein
MLRRVRSRIRFSVGLLGGVVLGASLLSWAYGQHAAAGRYTWVSVDAADAPPAETAELWHVSARCVRPYFVRALLRSKAELQAHYERAPDEIRARLNSRAIPAQSVEPAAWHPPASGRQTEAGRSNQDKEYVASLQVKYAEWYAALFKLEIQADNWQQRLLDLADQTVILSAASRKSFAAYSRGNMQLISSQGDFDGHLLTALGLGGLPGGEQISLKSDCVTVSLVKQRLGSPDYLKNLWRWPIDCLAEFLLGLELVLIAIFFAPVVRWMETGDAAMVARPVCDLANRLRAGIRNFDRDRFISTALERLRQMRTIAAAGYRFSPSDVTWRAQRRWRRR